ncbi:integrin alpha-6-like isoform X3 [Entelurus aequoreus]|uniref:integrin alpha-6-like isoform X3 n=1 Tax=Entelurus aequoreus TaxID=161455 RepID=UPI002B1DCDCB|nr:integrin alpha-6-like isoform X3 [Entelurus aequoreus]
MQIPNTPTQAPIESIHLSHSSSGLSHSSSGLCESPSGLGMSAQRSGVLWLLCLLLGCRRLSAFNLDTEEVVRKNGEANSLFGFSLAMHRQLEPNDKRILLVGAPKASALNRQVAKVTGGLFSCDMSSSSQGCDRVNFDNEEDVKKESKENQWMGVTVKSQGPGGKVVTCAHRYQRRTNVKTKLESRDIIGRCYVLSQDLKIDPYSSDEGGNWHFCDSRPRGHEMFGSCQQGLSATFDRDYHYIIFGAPGAYNWKGVVRLEQKNDTLLELGIYDDGPFEAGDENEKNPDLVPAAPNSYLGFSLDSGSSLTKKGQLTVVAGAPRANHSGSVVMLKKGPETSNNLLHEYTLDGEGLASSFGYDLAVLDLNGDGWEDIVVGAPQYFEKDGEIGGAVYVYVNMAGKWNKVKPTRIDGPEDSMFGLSVENLGDINQDGFHDFAVGAPYDDDGAGNVFIYHGAAAGLKSKKAAQILSGKPLGVKMFGYSLAGNMDLDKNSYPDLAVGSLSDAVFVYKARPVIAIKKEVTITPKEIDLTKKNCGNSFCLNVEACFTYTANPKTYSPRLTVAYAMAVDSEQRKKNLIPRASFLQEAASGNSYESKGTLVIDGQGRRQCVSRSIAFQDNIRDRLRGVPIDVDVDIVEAKRKRRQSSSEMPPVLDVEDKVPARSEVQFVKEGCGSDNICRSNLKVAHRYGYRGTDDGTFTPLPLENGVPVISLSNQKDVALEVKVNNKNGDDAHEASVVASFPRYLTYAIYHGPKVRLFSRTHSSHFAVLMGKHCFQDVTCSANKNGSKATCEVGNPFKRDSETTFYIILSTAGISLNTTELEVDLQPGTTSEQASLAAVKAKANVAILLQLSMSGQAQPSQVYYSGKVKDQSSMKSESDIGTPVTHQFRILNLAKRLADFGTATLHIDWPKVTDKGKWLLYPTKITSTGVRQMECSPKAEINPLKKEAGTMRSRRAAQKVRVGDEAIISRLVDKNNAKILSCDDGAKCVKIKCPLRGIDSNAVITVHSRLWNSTLVEDYSKVHRVEVLVKAFLQMESTRKNMVVQNAETQLRMTAFPERREASYGGVPWWIIFLSVLFALLLLALLIFLLWKCGVFGRKKRDTSEKKRLTPNA